jgi:translation initiation factor 2 subunit 2
MDYEDSLDRALDRTPEIQGGDDRLTVPDPEVRPEGNVTVYENFDETAERLGREPDDLLKFLQSELGTSAGIDESGRARLTGDFAAGRIADAVGSFVDTYVRCDECGLPDTRIVTEQGAPVLKCDACGALSPVPDR